MAAFGFGFLAFAARLETGAPPAVPHAEGVVALTGGADRISDAVDLVASGNAGVLLITGVNQATSGMQIARRTPRFRPLAACCIELGYEALNTAGNARETRRWAQAHGITHSLIVVTSSYHMPRALLELAHALPGVKLLARPVVGERARGELLADPPMLRLVAIEYVKYVAALVRTSLFADEPDLAAPRHAALPR